MFLQVLNELHGGFRRIGVTEIWSGARPIRWSRSRESLSEFSVPLLPNTLDQAGVTEPQSCKSGLDPITRFHPHQLDR